MRRFTSAAHAQRCLTVHGLVLNLFRTRPTFPTPVEPKAVSMPPEHGVGLDDDERVSPAGPQAAEPRPEQPIDGP